MLKGMEENNEHTIQLVGLNFKLTSWVESRSESRRDTSCVSYHESIRCMRVDEMFCIK